MSDLLGRGRRRGWLLLGCAVIAETVGALSLRAATDEPLMYGLVAAGFVTAFVLLTLILKTGLSISVIYGLWTASGVVMTAVMARVLFGEPLTGTMMTGIGVVVAGVLCIELGSRHQPQGAGGVG